MWFRSLYWRIGLGFIALLAVLLGVQALLVVWLSGPTGGWLPVLTPARLATVVASEIAEELAKKPDLTLESFVRQRFARVYQPFLVVMEDGRMAANHAGALSPGLVRAARARLRSPGPVRPFDRPLPGGTRLPDTGGPPAAGTPSPGGMPPWSGVPQPGDTPQRGGVTTPGESPQRGQVPRRGGGPGFGGFQPPAGMFPPAGALPPGGAPVAGGPQPSGTPPVLPGDPRQPDGGRAGVGSRPPADVNPAFDFASIQVGGKQVGVVAVATFTPQLTFMLRQLGPTLALVGAGLLILGAGVGSLVIFRPARQRLQKLEEAAAALGAGRTAVRAPEVGDDEVTALARAFNRMAAALEASDAARRRLLADVSHELRTPLTAIRGYVETLGMTEVALDEETRQRYLRVVGEESEKLETIVGELLDLARLEAGGGALVCHPVQVERLFARVADRHERALEQKSISLTTEVRPGAEVVWGNQDRLEQVLQNLAANAVRHTPEGGRIEIRAEEAGERIRISVRDTGPGIAPEDQARVFDRFYKADASRTTNQHSTGSGLGLSIAKAITERHGGTISAANADGGGALFEVTLNRPASADNTAA